MIANFQSADWQDLPILHLSYGDNEHGHVKIHLFAFVSISIPVEAPGIWRDQWRRAPIHNPDHTARTRARAGPKTNINKQARMWPRFLPSVVWSFICWRQYWFSDQSVCWFTYVHSVWHGTVSTNHLLTTMCAHLTLILIGCTIVIQEDYWANSLAASSYDVIWLCSTGPIHDNRLH